MPHNYGLISNVDAQVLEATLDLIIDDFPNQPIKVLELGVYAGRTLNGIKKYVESKNRECTLTGVDNERDGQERIDWPEGATLILGSTVQSAFQFQNFSQHLIIVDALHTFDAVITDFFAYKDKLKFDGFIMFHDAGTHIKPFTDYQKTGDINDPNNYISVRKALDEIGLLPKGANDGWELIFDEADETDPCGGYCVFKKIVNA